MDQKKLEIGRRIRRKKKNKNLSLLIKLLILVERKILKILNIYKYSVSVYEFIDLHISTLNIKANLYVL